MHYFSRIFKGTLQMMANEKLHFFLMNVIKREKYEL